MSRTLLLFAAALVTSSSLFANAFTIEVVEEQMRGRYPNARRAEAILPPGVVAYENIPYVQRGDVALQLDLYRPPGAGPFPAVIMVHGGGWDAGSRQMERAFTQRLAGLGYVAATISYRLGPDGRFPAALHDVKAAIRWLRAHAADYAIDPARIGAVGGSAGGHLVALLGASNGLAELEGDGDNLNHSSVVQAVVVIDGTANFDDPAMIAREDKQPRASTRFLGGLYHERAPVWRAASPLTHVHAASAPTLFINSTAGGPFFGREEMSAQLRALGRDSAIVVIPDTPHPFWLLQPWFETTLNETGAFLKKHLGPAAP
jgi:acetyl esterase/lipase